MRTACKVSGCIWSGAHIMTMPATSSWAAICKARAPPSECPTKNITSQRCLRAFNSSRTALAQSCQPSGNISRTWTPCPGKSMLSVTMPRSCSTSSSSSKSLLLPFNPCISKTPITGILDEGAVSCAAWGVSIEVAPRDALNKNNPRCCIVFQMAVMYSIAVIISTFRPASQLYIMEY